MESDILDGQIGAVGTYDLEFKGGKLYAKVDVAKEVAPGVAIRGDLVIEVGARPVLEALKKVIPGQVDDAFIELAAKALGV